MPKPTWHCRHCETNSPYRADTKIHIVQAGKEEYKTIILWWDSLSFQLHHCIQPAPWLMWGITLLSCISTPFRQAPPSKRWFSLQEWEILSYSRPLAMGIWRREGEDELRERQHPAQCQLGSVYQCWCILSGPECFTSDSISNSTWQTFTRDNRTLNCMLQSSTMTALFFSDLGPGSTSLHRHFRTFLISNKI